MRRKYCGKESPGRFCSRACWDAVEGFDSALKAERSVEFTDKHEANLAEWADGVRVGKKELPQLSTAALLALVNRDYRLPAILVWSECGKSQSWIGKRLGMDRSVVSRAHSHALQIATTQCDRQTQA